MNRRRLQLLCAACLSLFLAFAPHEAVSQETISDTFDSGLPNVVERVAPVYPERAIRNRLEGSVMVRCFVGEDGRVLKTQPVRGEPLFLKAAEAALRHWRFTPPESGGKPIQVWVQVPMRFELSSLISSRLESSDTTRVFVLRGDSLNGESGLDRFEGYAVDRRRELKSPKAAARLFIFAVQDSTVAPLLAAPRYALTFDAPEERIVALIAPDRSLAQLRGRGRTWSVPWTKTESDALAKIISAESN